MPSSWSGLGVCDSSWLIWLVGRGLCFSLFPVPCGAGAKKHFHRGLGKALRFFIVLLIIIGVCKKKPRPALCAPGSRFCVLLCLHRDLGWGSAILLGSSGWLVVACPQPFSPCPAGLGGWGLSSWSRQGFWVIQRTLNHHRGLQSKTQKREPPPRGWSQSYTPHPNTTHPTPQHHPPQAPNTKHPKHPTPHPRQSKAHPRQSKAHPRQSI